MTVNVRAALAPPPGAGLTTVTESVPAEARSLAGIDAVSWLLLTSVVVRLEPFTWTTDPLTKFVPFTVSVNAGPPTVVEFGEMLVSEGTGLLTVKLRAALVPPALTTVMERVPADAMSPAGIAALSCGVVDDKCKACAETRQKPRVSGTPALRFSQCLLVPRFG